MNEGKWESAKLLNFASDIEQNTLSQAHDTSKLEIVQPHLALMPDAHLGAGATVGSVIPTVGAVIPAAVGVDIGCGMIAVRTQWTVEDLANRAYQSDTLTLKDLHAGISRRVPLSAGGNNTEIYNSETAYRIDKLEAMDGAAQAREVRPGWQLQLGSLGSGNHFIEISADNMDRIWAFLHSGSRGVGNKLAQRYIRAAKDGMKSKYGVKLPNADLAYLAETDESFWPYIEALEWAQYFAWLNREEMMARVLDSLREWMGENVRSRETINCHHNYTEKVENSLYGGLWLSRKGAIAAETDQLGLIPGSMGTASYIVRGLGYGPSHNSAPHGAGRRRSRKAAKTEFGFDSLTETMALQGIVWGESESFLDEHPLAYKDIDQVMKDASSLVESVVTLRQLVNVKGA